MRLKIKGFKLSKKARRILIVAIASLLVAFVYLININSVPPISSASEQAAAIAADSGRSLLNDVTFLPQRAIDYVFFKLISDNPVFYRVVSALITLAAISTFLLLIKHWISLRMAVLSTALFASSTWVLFDARASQPDAMLLLALPLLLLAGAMQKIKEYDALLPLTSFAVATMLYIPGFWVFVLTGTTLVYRDLLEAWQELSAKLRALWVGGFIVPLLPLIYGLTRPGVFKNWFGIPDGLSLSGFFENLRQLPEQLAISGLSNPGLWLPGTPILDAVTLVFLALGILYVTRDKRYPIRRYVLGVSGIIGILLIGLVGPLYISLLLPIIYIFAAFGLTFLVDQWFHIFPKNPMARSFGLIAVSILVVFTCSYHIVRYHHAWPRAPETSEVFKS